MHACTCTRGGRFVASNPGSLSGGGESEPGFEARRFGKGSAVNLGRMADNFRGVLINFRYFRR